MFGQNQILKPENHSGEDLAVQEIFATLQGEGPYVGHPAIFIRLGGCNLACNFCDTEFDSYSSMHCDEIITKANQISLGENQQKTHHLAVITGGEPLRQPISLLCKLLLNENFSVQIETNGTIFRPLNERVKIICSPKSSNGRYYPIHPDLLPKISAFKFLISASNPSYFDIGEVGQNTCSAQIYVQPMDEYNPKKNQANIERALDLCRKKGYFLSLQTHKILQIP